MTSVSFNLIVAATPDGGIGYNGDMPWRLPSDLDYFMRITTSFRRSSRAPLPYPSVSSAHELQTVTAHSDSQLNESVQANLNVVIMGRKTWFSIPKKFRPLQNRINVVLTSNESLKQEIVSESTPTSPVYVFSDFQEALASISTGKSPIGSIFVMGGSQLYQSALYNPQCQIVFLTRVERLASTLQDTESKNTAIQCDTFIPSIPTDTFRELGSKEIIEMLGPNVNLSQQSCGKFTFKHQVYVRNTSTLV
ncbi:hypothetical protein BATDEDRAFT_91777 [Batrachochytrium dendrobatidis JAM81]|uniref:Dihydrofolate reductase n=2 Tax=Batrachochytrium dendrobatidis TaxID=109871 RepID=F4PBG6_BATDJ|nr:dihydrofolate reductase [Batrachochytrium dendrobatidis JAM81]EGF77441.1 hypothetical protein BATDEDRAFT_91777 [Batrachochytrium dendrobatidis JAM81]KAJ8327662.1 dihydrofolate reductase [Batrachochytrium dendrobatidis]KAK5669297.1 dihydrofolate reductase [Batrachochytrium dendrobatidis]OAJ37835.1 dihydrofolate reductase [Batrachochytrium dendrobatidis JEL423]|eukprot:XP_006682079.1 hypothetical protein BATDEDRAFT_91777 [Batrachochytrium dendrobatidis JAM81]